jgi:glycosyltransferase involved in cell wall biosynthesis
VSNFNPATEWLLRDEENCLLTPPYPTAVADRLGKLVEDPALRGQIVEAGLKEVRRYRWEEQIERVWEAMCLRDPALALTAPPQREALRG